MEGLSAFARGTLSSEQAFFAQVRALTTLESFEAIAAHLAGVPGRKNLVWISGGFPFSIGEEGPAGVRYNHLRPETQRAARTLNHSDTAVYPVDARGLVSQSTDPNAPGRVPSLREVMEPIDGLRLVADWTGGRAFAHSNDIGRAISHAVEDSRHAYVLGYYPTDTNWNDRFRSIEVKVRRRGVRVRHREGYFAVPPETLAPGPSRAAIVRAAQSPLEATAIPVDVTASGAAGTGAYTLDIRLDARSLGLQETQGRYSGQLVVAVAQRLGSRELVRDPDQEVPLSLDAASRDQLLDEGVRITRTVQLRPDARQVRIVVFDAMSGAIGSVFIDADRLRQPPARRTITSAPAPAPGR